MTDIIDRLDTTLAKKNKYHKTKFITDTIRWYVISILLIGFLFKFMHWPFGGVLVTLSVGISAFGVIVSIIEGTTRKNVGKGFLNAAFYGVVIAIVFKIQYWMGVGFVLPIAILLFVTGFILHQKAGQRFTKEVKVLIAFIICVFGLQSTSNSSLYYHTNITQTFHPWDYSNSYFGWDRYSYFLFLDGKKKEALEANSKALEMAIRHEDKEYTQIILNHAQNINH